MIKLQKGDKVRIRGFSGDWEVVRGADEDGDVSIKDKDGKGWFYVPVHEITSKVPDDAPMLPEPKIKLTPRANELLQSGRVKADIGGNPFAQSSTGMYFVDAGQKLSFEKESNNMSNRKVAVVSLIDPDAGLKPELALVKKFGTVVFDGSTENMKMKLVMDNDMSAILAKHNEKRAKEIDLGIRKATGQELKLQPVELSDLQWVIDTQH